MSDLNNQVDIEKLKSDIANWRDRYADLEKEKNEIYKQLISTNQKFLDAQRLSERLLNILDNLSKKG